MKKLMSCVFLKHQRQHSLRMLILFFITLVIFAGFGIMTPVFGQTDVNIILLHHSTGDNLYNEGGVEAWFANYNSTHGTNYQITERWYPNYPYYSDSENYPYDYWHLWVDPSYNTQTEPGQESLDYLTQTTGEHPRYDVIIFKHCFPGADISPDTGYPDVASSIKSLENYKLQYRALREKFATYPNTKFIVWTLVPLHRLATDTTTAARAKQFVDWVKHTWLTECGHNHSNISIFDFWGYAAESNPTPPQGQVNTLRYIYERGHDDSDSHPNLPANQTIGPIFSQFVVQVITENQAHLLWTK
ncbi:hypothetical protein U27_04745 [Candidatus Vecturithrix granuli]|uniref:Uncharacterized protein n=1 Tax=Vecturithrix granuli TaxID=1499967 RepID=A0A081BZM3_VECG1|nr:hypothetical protein U27_04745 [Candidatus Vecturithrix granuli]